MSFFQDEKINVLLRAIKLDGIKYIKKPASWSHLNCFQLTEGETGPEATFAKEEEIEEPEKDVKLKKNYSIKSKNFFLFHFLI